MPLQKLERTNEKGEQLYQYFTQEPLCNGGKRSYGKVGTLKELNPPSIKKQTKRNHK